ncbi:MAG: transposase [Propionibacteriaceae bacterium]|nr:transposase [Propionibacteriaceae bacterium]
MPSRLLDIVPARSKAVFISWLVERSETFIAGTEVVAMNKITGFKTAAAEEDPQAAVAAKSVPRGPLSRRWPLITVAGGSSKNSTAAEDGEGSPLLGHRTLLTDTKLLTKKQQSQLMVLLPMTGMFESKLSGVSTSG